MHVRTAHKHTLLKLEGKRKRRMEKSGMMRAEKTQGGSHLKRIWKKGRRKCGRLHKEKRQEDDEEVRN